MSERIILTGLDEQMQEAVADTRQRVTELHAELPRWGLVVWTAGNVSERVVVDRGDVGDVPHPLPLRYRLGRATRADSLRPDDDGRRVRRRHPDRTLRPHRRRLDRRPQMSSREAPFVSRAKR